MFGKYNRFYDLKYSLQNIGGQLFKTFNVAGVELDVTNKDVSRALWTVLEPAWTWGKSNLTSNGESVAIRTMAMDFFSSTFETFDRSERYTNTDKVTYILGREWGFVIGTPGAPTIPSGTLLQWGGIGLGMTASSLNYEKGTVLYGCARRGTEWKGFKLEFIK